MEIEVGSRELRVLGLLPFLEYHKEGGMQKYSLMLFQDNRHGRLRGKSSSFMLASLSLPLLYSILR